MGGSNGLTPRCRPVREVAYELYFRTTTAATTTSAGSALATTASPARVTIPDYATDTYGRPWDFAAGDDAGIDSWGNKPEYIRHSIADGLLKLDVQGDAYFIWGTMWGPPHRTRRPVRIDLALPRAGDPPAAERAPGQVAALRPARRPGRSAAARVLRARHAVADGARRSAREAAWHGVLTAFRIDPVKKSGPAHVEIAWIRLTPLVLARRGAVELRGTPPAPPARVAIELPSPNRRPAAGRPSACV